MIRAVDEPHGFVGATRHPRGAPGHSRIGKDVDPPPELGASWRHAAWPKTGSGVLLDVALVVDLRALGNQALTPFLAAAADDVAAVLRGHASTETILALPGAFRRLKGAFHERREKSVRSCRVIEGRFALGEPSVPGNPAGGTIGVASDGAGSKRVGNLGLKFPLSTRGFPPFHRPLRAVEIFNFQAERDLLSSGFPSLLES